MLVTDTERDVFLVDVATGAHEALPLTGWVKGFDTAHPWGVSSRGKKPFTWGWMKSLGAAQR